EEPQGFIRDAILRVIQEQPRGLSRHAGATPRIFGKERSDMRLPDLFLMSFEGLPRRACGQRTDGCHHMNYPPVSRLQPKGVGSNTTPALLPLPRHLQPRPSNIPSPSDIPHAGLTL